MHRPLPLLTALLVLVLLAACDRPFAEPEPPALGVVEPADPSRAIADDAVDIVVRAEGVRQVDYVEVAGQPLESAGDGLWQGRIALASGLNALAMRAFDVDDAEVVDTLYLLRASLEVEVGAPLLPEPRAGHTVTLLADGSVLVLGGVETQDGPPSDDGYRLPFGAATFDWLTDVLVAPRVGHTATRLPDGRVLVLGGATRFTPRSVADLEERAEIYDPATNTSTVLALEGRGPRRAHHTAILREDGPEPVVEIHGGWGDLRPGDTPRLGIRSDIRRFRVEGTRLVALDGPDGVRVPGLDVAVTGHSASALGANRPGGRVLPEHLVAGARIEADFDERVSVRLRQDEEIGLRGLPAAPLPGARAYHAATVESASAVLLLGGLESAQAVALEPWLYAVRADAYYRFPELSPLAGRWAWGATKLFGGRILAVGGFDASGAATTTSFFVDLTY